VSNANAFAALADQLSGTGSVPVALLGPLQRLQLLRQFETAQSEGRPIDAAVLQWLADAVRAFLARGGSLEAHLGIASGRRGLNRSPHRQLAQHERDAGIALLYHAIDPALPQGQRAEALVRIFHGADHALDTAARAELAQLKRGGVVELPTSPRQVVRIVRAMGVAYRNGVTRCAPSMSEPRAAPHSTPETLP
jgi:hypothetical protein